MSRNLEHLFLIGAGITDRGAIAETPALAGLKRLGLSGNEITRKGPDALAKSPYLTTLEYLSLRGNRLDKHGMAMLRNYKHIDID